MTKYRWYDHSAWTGILLDGLNELIGPFDASEIEHPSNLCNDLFTFVHASTEASLTEDDWKIASLKYERCYILFVSSTPWPTTFKTEYPNIHYISRPLHNISKYLSDNPYKISKFKKSCDEGAPDWAIFSPPSAYPEHLVAAYLLLIAEREGLIINGLDKTNIWSEAGKQFNSLWTERGMQGEVSIVSGEGWTRPSGNNVVKAINAIRRLFELISKD